MTSCAVYGCPNKTSNPSVHFYYFPKHPVISQQWISACWRGDPFDISTARICSIHFDSNSYTSEYEIVDYLKNYRRILKYDAVPTLFLPNPQTQALMKIEIDPQTTLSTTDTPQNSKQVLMYDIHQNVGETSFLLNQLQQSTSNPDIKFHIAGSNAIPLNSFTITPALKQETVISSQDDEKYRHITNTVQLETLKCENSKLKQKVEALELVVKVMEEEVADKYQKLKAREEETRTLANHRDMLHRSNMSLTEQKSILSKVFSESQIKILTGRKKIYWSNDDMAVGYTIRHLTNKRCYMYLTKNLHIPLPALSSIKRWSTLKKNECIEPQNSMDMNKSEDEDSS